MDLNLVLLRNPLIIDFSFFFYNAFFYIFMYISYRGGAQLFNVIYND